jgi:hypothetical protein
LPDLKVLTLVSMLALSLPVAAQSPSGTAADISAFPADVSFVIRVDARALAASPLLPRLLQHPEAANPLAQALGRPATLAKVRAIYLGLPASFVPETTELPVIVVGAFDAERMLDELASARGIRRSRDGSRELLEADGPAGTSYAAALGEGALALGDRTSVLRMLDVRVGKRAALASELRSALAEGVGADVRGLGRVPVALRGYLQATGGALAAPFAAVDRVAFEGSLETAMDVRVSLHPTTDEARQAIGQALGALRVFGPSRFANEPEVLSAIQSLAFTVGEEIEATVTVPRSLLLRLL